MKKNRYSLKYLLDREPAGFRKKAEYQTLLFHLKASRALQMLRFNRKTYSILKNARIDPDDLPRFTRSNKLFRNPFFPLYLKLKKEHLEAAREKKKKRQEYIYGIMKRQSPRIKNYLKIFRDYEKRFHPKHPVWNAFFYPGTKKKANELSHLKDIEWAMLFFRYIEDVAVKYPRMDQVYLKKIKSLFVMELNPGPYRVEQVKLQYRKLARKYHPDQGGQDSYFDLLQKSRDILIQ